MSSHLIPYRRRNSVQPFWDDFFPENSLMKSFFSSGWPSAMRVDVKETKDAYEIRAELPGATKDNIDLHVQDGILTIHAQIASEEKREEEQYLYSERRVGTFQRSFSLEGVRENEIDAKYENGILLVTLPKDEKKEPKGRRKIDIN